MPMNYCLSTAHSTRYHNLSPEINYFTELSRTLANCKNRYTNCSRGQNHKGSLESIHATLIKHYSRLLRIL